MECVYSDEPVRRPGSAMAAGDSCELESSEETALQGLSCAGYGSSVCVTASFGLLAAARVLISLAAD